MEFLHKHRFGIKFVGMLALVAVMTLVMLPRRADAEFWSKTDEEKGYNMYSITVALAEYVNDMLEPNSDGVTPGLQIVNSAYVGILDVGDAGAFVGYSEKGWLHLPLSSSSSFKSYASFRRVSTGNGGTTNSLYYYGQYGYLLGQLGYDTSASQGSGAPLMNLITGAILMLAYMSAFSVSTIFSFAISVLQVCNPFRGFIGALNAQDVLATPDVDMDLLSPVGHGMGGVFTSWFQTGSDTIFSGIYTQAIEWFTMFANLSWAVLIPMCIVFIVAMRLLNIRVKEIPNKVRRLITRMAFLVVGIPLCGLLYTAALNSMADVVSTGNAAATRIVASTFVDFQSWASNGRLAVPDGVNLSAQFDGSVNDMLGGISPSKGTLMNLRGNAYLINQKFSYGEAALPGSPPFSSSFNNGSSADGGVGGGLNGAIFESVTNDVSGVEENASNATRNSLRVTLDLLNRYMSGDLYFSSAYEGQVNAVVSANPSKPVTAMYNSSQQKDDFSVTKGEFKDLNMVRFKNADAFGNDGTYFNIFQNGGLTITGLADGNGRDAATLSSFQFGEKDLSVSSSVNETTAGLRKEQGLSSISMYNYLNTSFDSLGMTVYSSERASSSFVIRGHRSVSLVGTGLNRALIYLNTLAMLTFFGVVGWFYGLSIMFGNIHKIIKLIMAIPGAAIGSLRSIAKFITYTVVMIVEVIVTVFLYQVVCEIGMDLSGLLEVPFSLALNNNGLFNNPATNTNVAVVVLPLTMLFSLIVYIWFTFKAVKLRKGVVRAVDEAAGAIVDKFIIGTPAGSFQEKPQKQNIVARVGGSLAAGAGMALGGKVADGMMKRVMPASSPNQSVQSGSGSGGDGGNGPARVYAGGSFGGLNPDSSDTIAAGSFGSGMGGGHMGGGYMLPGGTTGGPVDVSGGGGGPVHGGGNGMSGDQGLLMGPGIGDDDLSRLDADSGQELLDSGAVNLDGDMSDGVDGGGADGIRSDNEIDDAKKDGHLKEVKGAANAVIGGARMYMGDTQGGAQQMAKGLSEVKEGHDAVSDANEQQEQNSLDAVQEDMSGSVDDTQDGGVAAGLDAGADAQSGLQDNMDGDGSMDGSLDDFVDDGADYGGYASPVIPAPSGDILDANGDVIASGPVSDGGFSAGGVAPGGVYGSSGGGVGSSVSGGNSSSVSVSSGTGSGASGTVQHNVSVGGASSTVGSVSGGSSQGSSARTVSGGSAGSVSTGNAGGSKNDGDGGVGGGSYAGKQSGHDVSHKTLQSSGGSGQQQSIHRTQSTAGGSTSHGGQASTGSKTLGQGRVLDRSRTVDAAQLYSNAGYDVSKSGVVGTSRRGNDHDAAQKAEYEKRVQSGQISANRSFPAHSRSDLGISDQVKQIPCDNVKADGYIGLAESGAYQPYASKRLTKGNQEFMVTRYAPNVGSGGSGHEFVTVKNVTPGSGSSTVQVYEERSVYDKAFDRPADPVDRGGKAGKVLRKILDP